MNCPACCQKIEYAGETLKCTGCSAKYHYACLNMTSSYFLEHNFELLKTWRCPDCANITRRFRNDNTPVRASKIPSLNDTTLSIDDAHEEPNIDIMTFSACKTPIQTKQLATKQETAIEGSSITLDSLSKLLDSKLEKNNQSLLSILKNTIQNEIQQSIIELKEDILKDSNKITREQDEMKNNINTLNKKIVTLQEENNELKQQLKEIKQNLITNDNLHQDNNNKKFVLFGLTEYDQETEYQLHYRIIEAFKDILYVDLTGYIEGLTRIGKFSNTKRPIIVELISKRMTKYVLDNTYYFKNTGLSISEYLNETALRHKKALQEHLRLARQQGHHAIIKNNKLIIDGRPYQPTIDKTKLNNVTQTANLNQNIDQQINEPNVENKKTTNKRNTDFLRANTDEMSTFRSQRH